MSSAHADAAGPPTSARQVTWRPSPEQVASSNVQRFMARHHLKSYDELLAWSVADVSRFWDAVAGPGGDLDLEWYAPYQQVLDTSRGWEWSTWWKGGSFNYVHNALDKHALGPWADQVALRWEAEEGASGHLTFRELFEQTNRCANALKALGVARGDRVGLFLPMVPEVVVAQLAIGKIGAIYTPIFSGFGAEAVATRLQDCDAKVLITCDGIPRRGKLVPTKDIADQAAAASPSVQHLLVANRAGRGTETPWVAGRDVWWDDALSEASDVCPTEHTDPEDPYMIIYTSGTTGRPKGMLHVHGGFPIKSAQDMAHCFDVRSSDTVFWLTDMGWMMGPWVIGASLTLGATVCLFDATPDYPAPDRLWRVLERHGVTVAGIGPTAIRALMRHGDAWVRQRDLSRLRVLGSSGEPWNPAPWEWYQNVVGGGHCPLINYSGGTECSGGIVSSLPALPEKPTSFAGPVPGMDADVVDESGRSVRGAVGELVIRQPWPGMTRGFWRENDRYLDAYWSRLPGVWVHGDWAYVDEDGYWYIQGRSDDTIKVAGKRVGPAEVESAAAAHPAVAEAAAVGVPDAVKGEKVVVFAVLKPGVAGNATLSDAIAETVVRSLGKSLRPDTVLTVSELPKTRSGKVMRRVIRSIYLGTDPGDVSSLDNPGSLDQIRAAGSPTPTPHLDVGSPAATT